MDLATRLAMGRTLAVLAAVEGAPMRSSTIITGMTVASVEGTMSLPMGGRWASRRIAILGRSTPRVIAIRSLGRIARPMIRDSIRIRVWTTRRSPIVEATLGMMVRAAETTATSPERREGKERGLRDAGLFSFVRGLGGRRWSRRRSGRYLLENR